MRLKSFGGRLSKEDMVGVRKLWRKDSLGRDDGISISVGRACSLVDDGERSDICPKSVMTGVDLGSQLSV